MKIIPKTDLGKFNKEILARGAEAALPHNLPDRWLRALGRDIVHAQKAELEGDAEHPSVDLSAPVIAVVTMMGSKSNSAALGGEFLSNELMEGLSKFSRAIEEEIIGRQTGIFLRRYTIDNFVST